MAITQISKITHRNGLDTDLPQLSGAELGWALDERRLYIGNGKLEDGAPALGNTQVLTEFSDILALAKTYTFKGESAGYVARTGATTTSPVTRTMQTKFDDIVSIKDFGAIGDGEADDTNAINRAFFQLFCREVNPETRRSLYFPAGVYKVTDTIKIPPYAKIWGEGMNSTVIRYSGADTVDCVLRTSDSKHQVDANIGNNNSIAPRNIEISSLTIESLVNIDLVYFEDVTESYFDSVTLKGNLSITDLNSPADDVAAVRVKSTNAIISNLITLDKCTITNCTYGVHINDACRGITISNSKFDTLYKGVALGITPVNGGPTGVRIVQNMFDNIFAQGVEVGDCKLNISAFNIFYDIANGFQDIGNPSASIVDFNDYDNISYGDMFQRPDSDSGLYPRTNVNYGNSNYSTSDLAHPMQIGTYYRENGKSYQLNDNSSAVMPLMTISFLNSKSFKVDYLITRGNAVKSGTLKITAGLTGSSDMMFVDDGWENSPTGIALTATQSVNSVTVNYTSTNNGVNGSISYSVSYL